MFETDRDRQKGRRTTSLEKIARLYECRFSAGGVELSNVGKFCIFLTFLGQREKEIKGMKGCV